MVPQEPGRGLAGAGRGGTRPGQGLPHWRRVLVVVAHPDDETFGLGAIAGRFAEAGASVHVLCFTHGEASTLNHNAADLHQERAAELHQERAAELRRAAAQPGPGRRGRVSRLPAAGPGAAGRPARPA